MSLITFKVKHDLNLKDELAKAHLVAEFAVVNRDSIPNMSSKHVKHLGLPAEVSCQIINKYKNNPRCKNVTSVNLIFPGRLVTVVGDKSILLSARKDLRFIIDISSCGNLRSFAKVNQVEADDTYFFITVTPVEDAPYVPLGTIGVDLNIASAAAVTANSENFKTMFLGRVQKHLRTKYFKRRQKLQRLRKKKALKRAKRKECHVINDLLHKVSRKIVDEAKKNQNAVVLEDLLYIRETSKLNQKGRDARRSLHSWAYSKLRFMVEYKSRLLGVPVIVVPPAYTSQTCSCCLTRGERNGAVFSCPHCQHTEHADVNAARNLARLGLTKLGLAVA
jgi:IS605 OrfB family transposase